MKYLKRRIPVAVRFAAGAGEMGTLEGPVRYERGDALMTGSGGESWPIRRRTFEATYDAVPPLAMGEDGLYTKKPIPVDATQISEATSVVLDNRRGKLDARPGDWIVTAPDGSRWVVEHSIFEQTYQPLPDPGE